MCRICYSQKDHRWKYNTAHSPCMLDTLGHKHTPRICNTSRFPTATMFQERASVLHYAHVGCLILRTPFTCLWRTCSTLRCALIKRPQIFQMMNSGRIFVLYMDFLFNWRTGTVQRAASSVITYQRCRPLYGEESRDRNTLYNTDCYCKLFELVRHEAGHPELG